LTAAVEGAAAETVGLPRTLTTAPQAVAGMLVPVPSTSTCQA